MANQQPMGLSAEIRNPALAGLAWLIGDWITTGSHPALAGKTFHGRTSFEWHLGGAFLLMRSEVDEPEVPSGLAIIGSDDGEERLRMIYFDERGTSRHMEVTAGEGFVHWRRDFAAFRQTWTITRDETGDKLSAKGRMSKDGAAWEDDLSLEYERASET